MEAFERELEISVEPQNMTFIIPGKLNEFEFSENQIINIL